ncbi:MAG: prepilin-type N-terminal cleavage/methylation domain-containing protein [Eubacteriales bacterium]|nr:prepilin-type N-terminal cleavage/methylation domain-containing protein [Eubacteriales bacterium]
MRRQGNREQNRGFTFIELVFVLAILVILIGITAPRYIKFLEQAQMSADVSNMSDLATAVKVATVDADYNVKEGRYIFTLENTGIIIEAYQGTTQLHMRPSDTADLKKGLESFFGGTWEIDGKTANPIIKLRYKKWTDENKPSQKVQLICEVDSRKVSASYSPDSFAQYAAEAKTKKDDSRS